MSVSLHQHGWWDLMVLLCWFSPPTQSQVFGGRKVWENWENCCLFLGTLPTQAPSFTLYFPLCHTGIFSMNVSGGTSLPVIQCSVVCSSLLFTKCLRFQVESCPELESQSPNLSRNWCVLSSGSPWNTYCISLVFRNSNLGWTLSCSSAFIHDCLVDWYPPDLPIDFSLAVQSPSSLNQPFGSLFQALNVTPLNVSIMGVCNKELPMCSYPLYDYVLQLKGTSIRWCRYCKFRSVPTNPCNYVGLL